MYSVYVPNGRTPASDHYHYKLAWLAALREVVGAGPEATMVCGDMNIAPTDADVFDPDAYAGQTHVTPPERAALPSWESSVCVMSYGIAGPAERAASTMALPSCGELLRMARSGWVPFRHHLKHCRLRGH